MANVKQDVFYATANDDWLPTKIPELIEWLTEKLDLVPPEFRSATKIEFGVENGWERGDEQADVTISYERPETDEETSARLTQAQRAREMHEAQLRRQYDALKAKFC